MRKIVLLATAGALTLSGCGQDLPSQTDNPLVEKARAALVCGSFFNLLGKGSLYQYNNFDSIKNYAMLGEESRLSLKVEAEKTTENVNAFVVIAKRYWIKAGKESADFSSFVDDHVQKMQDSEITELTSRFEGRLSGEDFLKTYTEINNLARKMNCALTSDGPFADAMN